MRQASQFGDPGMEQRFIARIVIDHQMASPALQKGLHMAAAATALIVEHNHRIARIEIVAAVDPEISPLGFTLAGIELLDRRFIGMQYRSLPEKFGQPVGQRLQRYTDASYPLCQGRTGNGSHRICQTAVFLRQPILYLARASNRRV